MFFKDTHTYSNSAIQFNFSDLGAVQQEPLQVCLPVTSGVSKLGVCQAQAQPLVGSLLAGIDTLQSPLQHTSTLQAEDHPQCGACRLSLYAPYFPLTAGTVSIPSGSHFLQIEYSQMQDAAETCYLTIVSNAIFFPLKWVVFNLLNRFLISLSPFAIDISGWSGSPK